MCWGVCAATMHIHAQWQCHLVPGLNAESYTCTVSCATLKMRDFIHPSESPIDLAAQGTLCLLGKLHKGDAMHHQQSDARAMLQTIWTLA